MVVLPGINNLIKNRSSFYTTFFHNKVYLYVITASRNTLCRRRYKKISLQKLFTEKHRVPAFLNCERKMVPAILSEERF